MAITSTQWRIFCIEPQSAGIYLAIARLEMRGSVGGADLCSGGTASTSGTNPLYPASNAFDGDDNTFWWQDSKPHWLQYTFASPQSVAQILIKARNDGYHQDTPQEFIFQYYNGNQWTDALIKTGETGWTSGESRTYTIPIGTYSGNITETLDITDWRVSAHRCSDGVLVGTDVFTGSTYSLDVLNTTEPCNITIAPKVDYAWSAGKTTVLGDFVVAASPDSTSHIWECTTAGTTHATTEPTWNLSGTTTDNTTTWTYVAPLEDPITLGPKIPS